MSEPLDQDIMRMLARLPYYHAKAIREILSAAEGANTDTDGKYMRQALDTLDEYSVLVLDQDNDDTREVPVPAARRSLSREDDVSAYYNAPLQQPSPQEVRPTPSPYQAP